MSAATFIPLGGTDFASGQEPELAKRTAALAHYLGLPIYGLSGARTPAHSVEVGGSANDPHTQGVAEDVGVGSQMRASAASVSDATLHRFGLTRPFPGAQEVNHWQLLGGGKHGVSLGSAAAGGAASGAALGTAIEPGIGTAIGAAGGAAVGAAGSLLQGPISGAESAAGKAAAGAVTDLADNAWNYVTAHWTGALLKLAFIIAGVALVDQGVATALGTRPLRSAVPRAIPVPVPA